MRKESVSKSLTRSGLRFIFSDFKREGYELGRSDWIMRVYSVDHPRRLLLEKKGNYWHYINNSTTATGEIVEKIPGRLLVLVVGTKGGNISVINSGGNTLWARECYSYNPPMQVRETHDEVIVSGPDAEGGIEVRDAVAYRVTDGKILWSRYLGTLITTTDSGDVWSVRLRRLVQIYGVPAEGWWQLRLYNAHSGALMGRWRLPNQFSPSRGFWFAYRKPDYNLWTDVSRRRHYPEICSGNSVHYQFILPMWAEGTRNLVLLHLNYNCVINSVYCRTRDRMLKLPHWNIESHCRPK